MTQFLLGDCAHSKTASNDSSVCMPELGCESSASRLSCRYVLPRAKFHQLRPAQQTLSAASDVSTNVYYSSEHKKDETCEQHALASESTRSAFDWLWHLRPIVKCATAYKSGVRVDNRNARSSKACDPNESWGGCLSNRKSRAQLERDIRCRDIARDFDWLKGFRLYAKPRGAYTSSRRCINNRNGDGRAAVNHSHRRMDLRRFPCAAIEEVRTQHAIADGRQPERAPAP